MQNLTIDGVGKISGGEYGTVAVDGVASCSGEISAETLQVDGIFKCAGAITVDAFFCDGMAKIQGNVKAGKIQIDGMLTARKGNKIEADEITCDGLITIDGEISADMIEADGCINAQEITGDSISIQSRVPFFASLFHRKTSRIKLIEATTVELRGVLAESVNGKDVRILKGCRIRNLDCSGTLYIAPGARVQNISGTYTEVHS